MDQAKIIGNLRKVFSETFEAEVFGIGKTMDDINEWDSLKHIQLLSSIEDHFNIEIEFTDAIEMISVENIIKLINKYLNNNAKHD